MATEVIVKNPKSLSTRLWSMKNTEEYCDAIVVVNGKTIPVHKFVLASESKYFDIFFKTTKQNVVTFQNVDSDALELLLEYCYKGTIKITLDNANEVLTLARILSMSMSEIFDQSLKIFENTYSFENCHSNWNIDQMGVVEKLCGKRICIPEKSSIAVDSYDKSKTRDTPTVAQQKSAKMTSFENHCNSSVQDDAVVVIGTSMQNDSNFLEIFDKNNGKWIGIEISYDCTYFSSVLLDDKIFLIGGSNNHGVTVNKVTYYDLRSGTMQVCPPMKYQRRHLRAVQCGGYVFSLGGIKNLNYFPYVEKFDPKAEKWTEVAPMNVTRAHFAAEVLDNSIYVVGGNECNAMALSSAEVYSVAEDQWKPIAPMLEARCNFGLVAVHGRLYAVGGKNLYSTVCSVEVYDPTIDKWTMLERSLNILEGQYVKPNTLNFMDKIIIGDGHRTEIFDPNTNTSEPLAENKIDWSHVNLIRISRKLAKYLITRKKLL